jgi:hypothetical protein
MLRGSVDLCLKSRIWYYKYCPGPQHCWAKSPLEILLYYQIPIMYVNVTYSVGSLIHQVVV